MPRFSTKGDNMTDNSIANETPNASAPFPNVPTERSSAMTNPPQPKSPQLARALQWASWNIRRKNRAGRPPLA
jgi:hypothetical protein